MSFLSDLYVVDRCHTWFMYDSPYSYAEPLRLRAGQARRRICAQHSVHIRIASSAFSASLIVILSETKNLCPTQPGQGSAGCFALLSMTTVDLSLDLAAGLQMI
jgi:hypothetical protein